MKNFGHLGGGLDKGFYGIRYSYFLLCFNVFSFIDNLNYSDIADFEFCFNNNSFNIMYLSFMMLSSFLWFLSFEVRFLNFKFWYLICELDNITLIILIFLDMSLSWILSCNFHLFHQTFIIIIVNHMFWYLFSSFMFTATIVEMHKLPKIQF